MRIIAGRAKGRKLIPPKNKAVRPTPDRVREALFNIIAGEVLHADVIDLFCGTGALGIEALSRGASSALFVDSSAASIRLTERNIFSTVPWAESKIIQANVLTWLRAFKSDLLRGIVFLDPPYATEAHDLKKLLDSLAAAEFLEERALIILEHSPRTELLEVPELELTLKRRYGDTALAIYRRKEND